MQKIQELKTQRFNQYQIVDFAYTELLESETFNHYNNWLGAGHQANMNYLEGERGEKRKNLKEILPNCKSALVFLFSHLEIKKYLLENHFKNQMASFVLGYAGFDYHHYIKNALSEIKEEFLSEVKGLICVDTLPVLERDLAMRSGLGFIGKNSMLIHPEFGSHVLIGTILLEDVLELNMRPKIEMDCGKCSNCIKSCPTNSIVNDYDIDSRKCISNFTIEERENDDAPMGYHEQSFIFGCDQCQDVCPFNIRAMKSIEAQIDGEMAITIIDFFLKRDQKDIISDLEGMSNKKYQKMFKRTSLERTGRLGMLKNLKN